MNDTVAVILPTFNGEKWVGETIDSILKQTYQFINLYIIDDGSTDNTLNILNEYAAKEKDKIFILEKKGKKGAPQSRDEAIRSISDKYIAFIDQDDTWKKNKIEKQVEILKVEGANLNYSNIKILKDGILNESLKENEKRNKYKINLTGIELAKKIIQYCPIRIGTVLLTKKSYLEVGGFNTDLFGGEDWEFWVRYTLNNNKISFTKEKLAVRRIHEDNTSITKKNVRLISWLKAAKQIKENNNSLKNSINKFYFLTYLRTSKKYINKMNIIGLVAHTWMLLGLMFND